MAGLLAWAADVVGKGGQSSEENDPNSIPLIFTPDQQNYVRELDSKAASLSRSIQDLRLRLPPPDIAQSLPHLHAHSVASNAALTLQLNAHSATKEQAQQREITLQQEDADYEKAISNCHNKIQEKLQEAVLLQNKLKEMDLVQKNLVIELENVQVAHGSGPPTALSELSIGSKAMVEAQDETEALKSDFLEKLEIKKKELASMEETVQELERKWTKVQEETLKQPLPAQREKTLDKQLHSLIEQLAAKQAQAEGLVNEIHIKEMELERLNGLWKRLETNNMEMSTTRNRSGRSSFEKGLGYLDYIVDPHQRPPHHMSGRNEKMQRPMLLRSAFVLYILALHILVFIKISF